MKQSDVPAALLNVVLDGEPVIEFDRRVALTQAQAASLVAMDAMMSRGVRLGTDFLHEPNQLQRAQFVAMQLADAIRDNRDPLIAATCAWLAHRIPDLRQVRIGARDDGTPIDLVFDRDYVKEVRVDFVAPTGSRKEH